MAQNRDLRRDVPRIMSVPSLGERILENETTETLKITSAFHRYLLLHFVVKLLKQTANQTFSFPFISLRCRPPRNIHRPPGGQQTHRFMALLGCLSRAVESSTLTFADLSSSLNFLSGFNKLSISFPLTSNCSSPGLAELAKSQQRLHGACSPQVCQAKVLSCQTEW